MPAFKNGFYGDGLLKKIISKNVIFLEVFVHLFSQAVAL